MADPETACYPDEVTDQSELKIRLLESSEDMAKAEALLNRSFPVVQGTSFFDDFPVWRIDNGADVTLYGAFADDALVALAGLRLARLKSEDRQLPVALIGGVCTDEAWRGKGLATQIVSECLKRARDSGAALVFLWGSEHSLYQKLGFELCGEQARLQLGSLRLPEPARALDVKMGWTPEIFSLMQARTIGLAQTERDEKWLSEHKNVQWYWLRKGDAVSAFVGMNRGIDLQNIVHEWGGERDEVLKLLAFMCKVKPELEIVAPVGFALDNTDDSVQVGTEFLAMVNVLDAEKVFQHFHPSEKFPQFLLNSNLKQSDFAQILFGPVRINDVEGFPEHLFPLPVWIWGLDAC